MPFFLSQLSLDDITQHGDVYNANSHGGAFHNLKGLVETQPSLSLPSVDNPAGSIEKISKKKGVKQHQLRSPYDLSSLKLNPEGGNHIKVHLPASDSPAAMRDIGMSVFNLHISSYFTVEINENSVCYNCCVFLHVFQTTSLEL